MKTPLFLIFAANICALAQSQAAENTLATGLEPDRLLPVGNWNVTFTNGAAEVCEIRLDGTVSVTEAARNATGKAVVKGAAVEIRYDDDRAERWTMDDDWQMVDHSFPAASKGGAAPVRGVAMLKPAAPGRLPVWNDRISSARLGRNVRILAYENTEFSGACLVLDGGAGDEKSGGTWPEFRSLTGGLTAPANWNDRISSLKVLAKRAEHSQADPDAGKVVFFGNANCEGEALELQAGIEIGDLTQVGLSPVPMKVHEWGTFTVLEGTDGMPIEWYQAPAQLVDLPSFVKRPFLVAGKSGTAQRTLLAQMDTIRMETPVLYFYPEKEMDITVSASFPSGRITEAYPPAVPSGEGETVWKGRLLRPDSPERQNVPAAPGKTGRHYAAARAVPDAWLFRGTTERTLLLETIMRQIADQSAAKSGATLLPPPKLPAPASPFVETMRQLPDRSLERTARPSPAPKQTADAAPIDHFIFYRGAANRGFELKAVEGDDPNTFTLTNSCREAIPRILALRVRDGLTSWLTMERLEPVQNVDGKPQRQQTVTFPAPAGAVAEVATKLRVVMIDCLTSEGLTKDEAAAMVATWDDLWFTEPGTRFLALLPRGFADEMVPLTIIPPPAELDRVFVARLEIITRSQEQMLTDLLTAPASSQDSGAASERFQALHLGRYAAGGMERAVTIVNRSMRERINALSAGGPKLTAAPRN